MVFAVEAVVNALVWQNRPVIVKIVGEDAIATIPCANRPRSRARSAWSGSRLRCLGMGGPTSAPQVRWGSSRLRPSSATRVGFGLARLCGRALRHYQTALHTLQAASLALSVGPDDLVPAIARLEDEAKALRRDVRRLRETVLDDEAGVLWTGARVLDGVRVVVAHWAGRDFAEVRALAGRLRSETAPCSCLLSRMRTQCAFSSPAVMTWKRCMPARSCARPSMILGAWWWVCDVSPGGTSAQSPDAVLAALQRAAQV